MLETRAETAAPQAAVVALGGNASSAGRGERARGPVHVASVLDNLGPGGTEYNAIRTAERLDRSRVRLQLISLQREGPMAPRYAAAGVPVHPFPPGGSLVGRSSLRQARALARHLRAEGVEVVHCHDRYSNVFGVLAARLAGIPVIASKRWWRASTAHRVLNALAYRAADRVLCNSASVARSARELELAPADRIVVVPNFVDDDAFAPVAPETRAAALASFGVPADVPVVGIVARFRPVKDHATLFRAVQRLAAAPRAPWLVVAGDGPQEGELRALVAELGIGDRVRFAGLLPHHPNPHAFFDVSVLCSLHEGFPNTVVEAMAASRPVVATRVGGVLDAVVEGETGLLVPVSDADALAAAISTVLADPARAARMGAAGRRIAAERFRAETVIDQLESVYESLARRPAHRAASR